MWTILAVLFGGIFAGGKAIHGAVQEAAADKRLALSREFGYPARGVDEEYLHILYWEQTKPMRGAGVYAVASNDMVYWWHSRTLAQFYATNPKYAMEYYRKILCPNEPKMFKYSGKGIKSLT